jgi:tyrosyl-tRNA synthetase
MIIESGIKKMLAGVIVHLCHGDQVDKEERKWFANTFSKKIVPDEIPVVSIDANQIIFLRIITKTVVQIHQKVNCVVLLHKADFPSTV